MRGRIFKERNIDMLKMIKYEYRKNIFSVIILLIVMAAIQAYTIGAALMDKRDHVVIGVTLFMVAASASYIFVLLYGILSYSRDLKNKDGYLVFMTPLSSYQIIGAKLLTTLITGVILVFIIGALGVVDYIAIAEAFNTDSILDMFEELLTVFGYDLTSILLSILGFVIIFLIQFFMTVTMAYFAISLSCTILQNSKAKGFISLIFFVIFYVVISVIASKLPLLDIPSDTGGSLAWELYETLPQIILYTVCMVACYLGSSVLLDKKISL